jgi:C1A family cysteine protease
MNKEMSDFYLGCYKSSYDKRDWLVTSLVADMVDVLPIKYDITDKMTLVQNQGNEGSCVGFSGCAIKEYQEQIDYSRYIRLSERFIYEESKKISGHSEGTTLKACAKVLVEKGICEYKFWEYKPKEVGERKPGADANALKYRIQAGYVRITNEKELKASLIKYGAIHLGVLVYRNWYKQNKGHIPNLGFWDNWLARPLGGHAIALVGYNDETKEYKFKNSWGKDWGDAGYGYISFKHMKQIMMDAICYIDIDDPNDFVPSKIKTVNDLSSKERKNSWI